MVKSSSKEVLSKIGHEKSELRKRITFFAASIAPGLFLLGYNIGTGSITTMAAVGAQYGLKLIWALLLSCIFTYFLIITFGRFTLVTGKTILQSFRERFGYKITWLILLSLILSELASAIGVMGVITEVVTEWSRPFTTSEEGIPSLLVWFIFSLILLFLLWQGKYKFFEKVLAVFVGLMAGSFLMTMFISSPPPMDYLMGMIPIIPAENNAFLMVSGMVGTTMAAVVFVARSILVSEKGWSLNDLKVQKRDAAVSSCLMFVISLAVMACAAGILFPKGLQIHNAIDMVNLMEPLVGKFASTIFMVGIVCAGLSSLLPIILLAPWLIADFQGKKSDLKSNLSRILIIGALIVSITIPLFGGRPVFIMITSQALAIMVTPLVLALILVLLNDKKWMGNYRFDFKQNLLMTIILLFTIYMAVVGFKALFF